MVHDSGLDELIAFKGCPALPRMSFNVLYGFQHVEEGLPVVPHNGRASLSTRLRIRALIPFSLSTSTLQPRRFSKSIKSAARFVVILLSLLLQEVCGFKGLPALLSGQFPSCHLDRDLFLLGTERDEKPGNDHEPRPDDLPESREASEDRDGEDIRENDSEVVQGADSRCAVE